ncbi:MAG: hypothetical protein D6761_14010 [Candidatus Dadabacteria bacterium]|nr:MAG: hypothetical protein D6761_14010 [Candidatus Dadabacteria bacterium]
MQPDQPAPLAREAVDALVRIGTKSDIERLIGMADQLADGGVQRIADGLLASDAMLGEAATNTLARRTARSRSQSLRLAVARALDRQRLLGNAAAIPALGQMRSTAASRDELRLILNAQRDAGVVSR